MKKNYIFNLALVQIEIYQLDMHEQLSPELLSIFHQIISVATNSYINLVGFSLPDNFSISSFNKEYDKIIKQFLFKCCKRVTDIQHHDETTEITLG